VWAEREVSMCMEMNSMSVVWAMDTGVGVYGHVSGDTRSTRGEVDGGGDFSKVIDFMIIAATEAQYSGDMREASVFLNIEVHVSGTDGARARGDE